MDGIIAMLPALLPALVTLSLASLIMLVSLESSSKLKFQILMFSSALYGGITYLLANKSKLTTFW